MADDVTLPGTGAVIATDEVSSKHYQRVKVTFGGDGSATDVSGSNPLPVVQTGSLPAGSATIGKVQVDGSVTVAALPAGSNNIGDVDVATQPARVRTADTISAAHDAVSMTDGTSVLTVKFASISTASSGYTSLVAAVPGKKIRVLSYVLVAAGAVTAQFASASSARTGAMPLAANGGVSAQSPTGLFETAVNEALRLNLGGAVQVSGHLSYVEV